MHQLTHVDQERNARAASTPWQLTQILFSEWVVVREWGRIGRLGTMRRDVS